MNILQKTSYILIPHMVLQNGTFEWSSEMVLLNGTLLHTADLLFKSVTLWTGAWESGSGWGLGVPKLTKKHNKDVKTLCVIKLCSNGPTIARYPKRQAKRGAPTSLSDL
jgi:hypothetical protein